MASTSGTNTVRDNSILPQCNALYLSFNGLLSQPPPLHWKKSFLWFITKYPADKLILPHLTFQVIFNFRMINLTSAIAQDIWQQRWKFKNAIHMLTKNRPIHPTHPLLLHKAPKAHFVSHTNQKKRYQQYPLNRNSGNKDTNYMLAILDSRMKIVAHERFQYVLLKKFGE